MKRLYILLTSLLFLVSCSEHKPKEKTKKNINVFYDKAFEYGGNEQDSAFVYFNKAQELFIQQNDSLSIADCYLRMALIANKKGDYFSGQEFSLDASSYLNPLIKDQHLYIVANLNTLGDANYNLKDYSKSIENYEEALKYNNTKENILKLQNNIANALRREEKYTEAIVIYQNILAQNISSTEFARVLSNFAFTKWLQNPNYNAAPEFSRALQIREKENIPIEKNAIYSNLADYYLNKNPDSALFYAQKMYQVTKITNRPDDKLQALQKLIKLASPQLTKSYFEIYTRLDDSLQTARNTAKNQFALIRFGVEKSKTEISKLEKENTAKKYQIMTRELILLGTILLFFSLAIIFTLWYKKRKQRLELEAENKIRENQLKTSKKVHDVVANKIYSVISEIENRRELDTKNLLDKLDHIYHTSRDISYEITDNQQGRKFSKQLSDMFYTYVANPPNVKITGNEDEIWVTVSNHIKGEIFIVLQELMINMKKHSQATEVDIQFHKKDRFISVHYHDNGIGLPKILIKNNGLRNTETRIKNISGTLTFETINKLGLKILISFPIN